MVRKQLTERNGGTPQTKSMQVQCDWVFDATCDVESLQRFALQSSTLLKQVKKCLSEWTSAHTNKVGHESHRGRTHGTTRLMCITCIPTQVGAQMTAVKVRRCGVAVLIKYCHLYNGDGDTRHATKRNLKSMPLENHNNCKHIKVKS